MRKLTVFFIIIVITIACNKKKCIEAPEVSGIEIDLQIERLDQKLHNIPSKEDLKTIIQENPVFSEQFLFLSDFPDTTTLVNRFYKKMHDPNIDTLFMEVERVFGDFSDIEIQFKEAFQHIKYYYPDFRVPKIKTVVTGMNKDLYLSDSLLIIGLDYYLGENARYQPLNIPEYILKRYQKEYMVSQCMLLLSNTYNHTNYKDQTMLAEIVYYGKAYYFVKNMMPCVEDSLITGYSSEEMQEITDHEDVIWASFLENEVLFETNHFVKDKFISERPKTYEIGENCPGRIGRWVGWRILDSYTRNNPEVTFKEVMDNDNALKIFEVSKYKPVNY